MLTDDDEAEAEYSQAAEDGARQCGGQLGKDRVGQDIGHEVAYGDDRRTLGP